VTQEPLIVITGPTGVGKSALALEIAHRRETEILSADSRQVYRYMDIGTAKPTLAERAAVVHHMVDVAYPNERYSVVEFRRDAQRALALVRKEGRGAIVVGGSPHYIQALVDGLRPAPRHELLRGWLDRADETEGGQDRLDAWLGRLDPAAARGIDRRNRRRVLRAIEVILLTGRPFSDVGRQRDPSLDAIFIGLRTERTRLYARIRGRLEAMVRDGWLEELRLLLAMGYSERLPALTATGYSQLAGVLRGERTLPDALELVEYATHAFVRRQETWLRHDARVHWVDADAPGLCQRALAVIDARIAAPGV